MKTKNDTKQDWDQPSQYRQNAPLADLVNDGFGSSATALNMQDSPVSMTDDFTHENIAYEDDDALLTLEKNAHRVSSQSVLWAANHFLLHPGARVAVADCGDGKAAYELAESNPRLQIIGLDKDGGMIKQAKETYKKPNLSFEINDTQFGHLDAAEFDGVLNYFNLHYLYSIAGYSQSRVLRYLQNQINRIKVGGVIVIQGYISPDNNENNHVLIELSDYKSNSQSIQNLSEAELLIRFSQTARPLDRSGCKGFYLEELKARIPHTRLFRLPMKWANEFLLRKDKRAEWLDEINKEYTPFTFDGLQHEINRLGARVMFYSPYWDKKIIENDYQPKCRLFNEMGELLEFPATSFTAVIQKMEEPGSVTIRERRASSKKPYYLKIDHVKDETSGRIYDLVSRPKKTIDIVPFRVGMDGRVTVYARDNFARPIVNTVPRKGMGLDGKYWSGHLIEPITYQIGLDEELKTTDPKLNEIVEKITGLSVKKNGRIIEGPDYYPSPLFIDEKVETIFVEVNNPKQNKIEVEHFEEGFHSKGTVKGLDAQDILKAAHVGLLADGKLEIAVYNLMAQMDITPETWMGETVPVGNHVPKRVQKPDDIITDITAKSVKYKQTMRSGGTLSVHRSLFVEEGFSDGETTGIEARSMEFAVPEDETINVAVVMPLTRDKSGEILAGFQVVDYPAPARLDGQSTQVDTPAFILPRDVKTIMDAKKYIAKQFGVKPDRVGQMGSSYFCDTGITPQRIYPFVIASPAKDNRVGTVQHFAPIKDIAKITFKFLKVKSFMTLMCETNHCMGTFHALKPVHGRENIIQGTKYTPKLSHVHTPSGDADKSVAKEKTTTKSQDSGNSNPPQGNASESGSKKKKPLIADKPQPK